MQDLFKKDLEELGLFHKPLHPILEALSEAIPIDTIPKKMKLAIAVAELGLYSTHFRRSLQHWNGALIPTNVFSFCIAGSGKGKDSAKDYIRACFASGYEQLKEVRNEKAKELAIQEAAQNDKPSPESFSNYKEFLIAPNPLFVATSTQEGLFQHMNDLDEQGIGAVMLTSGEFGSELSTNPLLIENLRLLSEMYDTGNKEVKILKNRENQSKELTNFPVNGLFYGSPKNLLYEESVKKKFKEEFSSKQARRSFFNFNKIDPERRHFDSSKELLAYKRKLEDDALQVRGEIDSYIAELTPRLLEKVGEPITIEDNVRDAFNLYREYNELVAETISSQFEISKIVRMHLQWKALKLAGSLAILDGSDTVTLSNYGDAVSFCEYFDTDMMEFEQELVKEPYEVFVDYMNINAINNKFDITLHSLRKMGYIPMSGSPTNKIKDLIQLADSYDTTGIYTSTDNGIAFERIEPTDTIGVSYLPVDNSAVARAVQAKASKDVIRNAKSAVASTTRDGYTYEETTFSALGELLQEDFAYSPFLFQHGRRGKDFVESGCKWIYLDIDDSNITDEEAHLMLIDLNHHIVRTSNPDNAFKFRALIELDSMVDVPDIQWTTFIKSITEELVLTADLLPKAQIAFSYANRTVLSVTDASPLEVKQHLIKANEKEQQKPRPNLTTKQSAALLNDPQETFNYAFSAQQGGRSRSLIRAAYHAKDLGASTEEIVSLMEEINNYWIDPLAPTRFENTILTQVRRWN